ncbi:Peptidase M16 inactive domain protein [compost metagenome]
MPLNAIYKAYHIGDRKSNSFYPTDLISDILSRGDSSRLYRSLVKEQQIFSEVNAYVSGDMDPGLFIVEGKLVDGISMEAADKAINNELNRMKSELLPPDELTKVKNKIESTMVFSELNLLDRAMNLAYYELMGDAANYNKEKDKYQAVTASQIQEQANVIFAENNCSTLYYLSE